MRNDSHSFGNTTILSVKVVCQFSCLVLLLQSSMSVTVINNILCRVRTKHVVLRQYVKNNSTAAHTLRIAERIKTTREQALLGGGQKRIDQQHQKVSTTL